MHLQNTCIVFDSRGIPTGSLFRDFGGIRLVTDQLLKHGVCPGLAEGSAIDADVSAAQRNVVFSTLQTHIGELIRVVVNQTSLNETDCWARVANQYESAFERLGNDSRVEPEWIDRDRSLLFADTVPHDSRMAMRLEGLPREQSVIKVSNPLASFRGPKWSSR